MAGPGEDAQISRHESSSPDCRAMLRWVSIRKWMGLGTPGQASPAIWHLVHVGSVQSHLIRRRTQIRHPRQLGDRIGIL